MVSASRPISSRDGGRGTRRCSCAPVIVSTSTRIASTGASAHPTTRQAVAPTTTSNTGSPSASSVVSARVDSTTPSRVFPSSTVRPSPGRHRDDQEVVVVERHVDRGGTRPATSRPNAGRPAALGVAASTSPEGPSTCSTRSSSPATAGTGSPPACTTLAASAARSAAAACTSRTRAAFRLITSATAPTSRATPTTATAPPVVRTRTEPRRTRPTRRAPSTPPSAAISGQPVSGPSQRLDRRPPERTVQLVPQMPHIDLDDVRVAVEVEVPHVGQDLPLAEHLAAAAQQELQQDSSRLVNASSVAPRQARRDAGSRRRSPADRTAGRSGAPRRSSARSRATSTACENGLVR